MKKVFIGSSAESVRYAEALQANINNARLQNLQAVCWHQGVFKIGHFTLEDLLEQLGRFDFGVFIFAKDDYIKTKGENVYCVRDNVIFELGMFLGALGRERVFCLIPNDHKYHIPSDLFGMYCAKYQENEEDISLAVGTACTSVKEAILKKINESTNRICVKKIGLFPSFDCCYHSLFSRSLHITTYFVHSRKWREDNLTEIDDFLKKDGTKWDVVLPDVFNKSLLHSMREHFDDGENLLDKILDCYRFVQKYYIKYPKKIIVHSFSLYPSYSFYKFDDDIIVSMYPLTSKRHPTPTFLLSVENENNKFFQIDINCILNESVVLNKDDMKQILEFNYKS